jgi:hypothetical protein
VTGFVLGWLLAIGMAALGVVACLAPGLASALYGVPEDQPAGRAWVRAAGLRDAGLAVALAACLAQGWTGAAGAPCLATALVAIADVANVVAHRGRAVPQLVTHASGIALGLAAGGLLLSAA